jgi:hypothetical protein
MTWKSEDATHRCKVCGALWRLCKGEPDKYRDLPADYPLSHDSWSLVSPTCGKCCDNVAMGDQIEYLPLL